VGFVVGHLPQLLVMLLVLAAIVWVILYGVRAYHRKLHRHL
jgi:hypothetical protein